ncbi:MAG: hypothetical protein ACRYF4_00060 [Janthinobacterium lividum]
MDSIKAAVCAGFLLCGLAAEAQATLAKVQERGALLCGIDRSEAESSSTDEHGNRAAFDRDLCRAAAVAVLGPSARMDVTYYADDATAMDALVDGKADLVPSLSIRSHPVNAAGEARAVSFSQPVLNDATGLMVLRESGITTAEQLSEQKICYLTETETEANLQQWFTAQHLDLLPFPFQEEGEMEAAFVTDNCAALGGDLTRLAQTRASTGTRADEFVMLQQTFGPDTLATAYRSGDAEWAGVVAATLDVLFRGEPQADTKPLLLGWNWSANVRAAVGTYEELFTRDLGSGSVLKLDQTILQPRAPAHDLP